MIRRRVLGTRTGGSQDRVELGIGGVRVDARRARQLERPRVGQDEAAIEGDLFVLQLSRVVSQPREDDVEPVADRALADASRKVDREPDRLADAHVAEADVGEADDTRDRVDVRDVDAPDLDREIAHRSLGKRHDLTGRGARFLAELHVEGVTAVEVESHGGDRRAHQGAARA